MGRRSGFTMVELLVVIAIIAVLAGLILAAVQSVRGREQAATTAAEINEMKVALEKFKSKYGVYPPSQVTMAPGSCDAIMYKIWPALKVTDAFGPSGLNLTGSVTLTGDQCLVFFLGGRPNQSTTDKACMGFSTVKSNPFAADSERDGPYFNFKGIRLVKRDASSPFYSYLDGWSTMPYAYFAPGAGGYSDTHCNSLKDSQGNFPKPYQDASGKYVQPQTYQILSAGHDFLWGAARTYSAGSQGGLDPGNADNFSNFANGMLSAAN